ncbi:hypothetical protein BDP27DRAFT_1377535 [Rhodocollybia butyracea]|uniref:Uncharacterized protein n=1 Tax=Rhodocollybia butyracea TaxID=206335 RepID=A0A9P5TVR6_9AGAR|nr:hypothetical protein BDP27DRAFT_1377535 [Rhodocollybia butyracea]
MSQQVSAHITREQGNNGFFTGAHNFSIHDAQFNNYVTLSSGKDIKQKLREELKFVEDAGIDDDKICLPDTRRAIIKEITDWVQPKDDSKASRTYILYGEAGTGKSAIAIQLGKSSRSFNSLLDSLPSTAQCLRVGHLAMRCTLLLILWVLVIMTLQKD